jgi:membrane fusion protein, heavy metal efflux system
LEIDGKEFVYIAQPDGTYVKQEVKVGSASDDYLRILHGLKLGDRVVTKGAILLKGNESKG